MTPNIKKVYWLLRCLLLTQTMITEVVAPAFGAGMPGEQNRKIITDGEVIFGGLFPMHEKGQNGTSCGQIKKEKGIQRLEAMLYAVDTINKNPTLLPGITIGVHILDTCSLDTYALEQCMDFIKAQLSTIDFEKYKCTDGTLPRYKPLHPVAGVIGAASSLVSIMVANILRLFKIPQISYASTSIDLSDKTRFEYFSRVVAPDSYQAQTMVDIAKALGWNYVNTIADDGTYGEKGIGAFVEKAANAGICISMSLKIPRSTDESTFRNIVKEILVPKNTAKVVVMFVNEDNCKRLLKALLEINRTSELFFLASDSWGAKIHPVFQQEVAAEGAVTILPKRQRVKAFDHYFLKLDVRHQHNIWFKEFWETIFNCSSEWTAGRKSCTGRESLHDAVVGYEQEGLVQFVIDSVYALAHAIHNMLVDRCPKSSNFRHCKHLKDLAGKDLLEYIRNVSFTGAGGNKVKFDGVGDAVGRYDIYQYQILDTGKYIKIGDWEHRLSINTSAMLWKNGSRQAPKSVCSEPCRNGESKNNMSSCCWMCVPCAASEFLENEFQCRACPKGSRPSVNKTMCAKLPELYLRPHSLWFILPAAFSVFGTLCTCSVFIIFLAFNRTPVIMASGRELCYLLLLGILLSYGTSLAMLAKPNIIFCALQRLGLGVSLCFIYAALLTKTNRIYRIFNSGIKAMVKRPGYTSPRSQIFLCLCLVSVQIVGGLTWLGFETPSIKHVSYQKDYLVLKCRSSQIATMISLFYNMLLIVLCTVYAFKTRKIPQNFNEAKYIAFTMYSTCIVWLAFIPIYFGANHDYKIEVTSLCMCVSISSTVALFCLFAPKVYIVLCQPHKNVRQGSAPSVQITATTKTSRSYSAQAGSNGAQNGSIHREIQCTDSNIFPDSVEENSSCDEGVAMRAPSSCAS